MANAPCPNHPEAVVSKRCGACQGDFCGSCVIATDGGPRCPSCQFNGPPKKGKLPIILLILLVVGFVSCIPMIAIVAAISIPNLLQARKHANETSARGAMRTLITSEAVFKEGDKDHNDKLDYGSLGALAKANLIDRVLARGTKQGYRFRCEPGKDPEQTFWAMADPILPGSSGDHAYYTNQTGVIYSLPVTPRSPAPLPDPDTGAPPPGASPAFGR